MKYNNSVFTKIGYLPWKYPLNWYKNIGLFFRRFKWAGQRAIHGFADCDIWDMDSWVLDLFHESLNYLADNHFGWPGDSKFPEDEDWTKYLKDMAQKFYQAGAHNNFYPTPEGDKWWKWIEEHPTESVIAPDNTNPYRDTMFKEECANDRKRNEDFKEAWKMMGDVFWNLWD